MHGNYFLPDFTGSFDTGFLFRHVRQLLLDLLEISVVEDGFLLLEYEKIFDHYRKSHQCGQTDEEGLRVTVQE